MDDNYVLKYIPVMTDEGKQAHFGDPGDDDSFDPDQIEQEKHEEYLALVEALHNDDALNDALEALIGDEDKSPKFTNFKKRLVKVIVKTKLSLQDIHKKTPEKHHNPH